MNLGSPSLKVSDDEKVHFGLPGISGMKLYGKISSSWVPPRISVRFDRKMKPSARIEVVDVTKVRQNSMAFFVDNSLLEAIVGTYN